MLKKFFLVLKITFKNNHYFKKTPIYKLQCVFSKYMKMSTKNLFNLTFDLNRR